MDCATDRPTKKWLIESRSTRLKSRRKMEKIRRINRVLVLITFTFVVGTLTFHELKRKMQKTSSFMQYFHNNS